MCGVVPRSTWIDVEYSDAEGQTHVERLKGLNARIFQHELDHLNGVIFTDRATKLIPEAEYGSMDETELGARLKHDQSEFDGKHLQL